MNAERSPVVPPPPPPPPPTVQRNTGYAVTTIVVTEPGRSGSAKESGQLPMKSARTRPPLRFDRYFYRDPENQLKLIQLATGAYCFLMTKNCYPNGFANYCTGELFTFLQLFQLVCVNSFCFSVTVVLLACTACGVSDTFYHYNFPILERLYSTMATVLYAIGALFAAIDFYRVFFSVLWAVHLATVLLAFSSYAFDCWRRWQAVRR